MTSEGYWRTEWMFRLLDYEHYRIFHGDQELGLVIINHADQSVHLKPFEETDPNDFPKLGKNYRQVREWLRRHESQLP